MPKCNAIEACLEEDVCKCCDMTPFTATHLYNLGPRRTSKEMLMHGSEKQTLRAAVSYLSVDAHRLYPSPIDATRTYLVSGSRRQLVSSGGSSDAATTVCTQRWLSLSCKVTSITALGLICSTFTPSLDSRYIFGRGRAMLLRSRQRLEFRSCSTTVEVVIRPHNNANPPHIPA